MFSGRSLGENSMRLLFNLPYTLPTGGSSAILKSQYLTKACKLFKGNVALPQFFNKGTARCPYCSIQYKFENTLFTIDPERKDSKFTKKLLKKGSRNASLTSYQAKRLAVLKKKGNDMKHNKLVLTCAVCKKKTGEKLQKPKPQTYLVYAPKPQPPKKKKRKRDRFTGLNREAVLSSTPQKPSFGNNKCNAIQTPSNDRNNMNLESITNKTSPSLKTPYLKAKEKRKSKQEMQELKNVITNTKSRPKCKLLQFLTDL